MILGNKYQIHIYVLWNENIMDVHVTTYDEQLGNIS